MNRNDNDAALPERSQPELAYLEGLRRLRSKQLEMFQASHESFLTSTGDRLGFYKALHCIRRASAASTRHFWACSVGLKEYHPMPHAITYP